MDVKIFPSSEGNVWKYVYEFPGAIAEAVLYKYESFYKRTVICCSVQSGCPIGCVFCGTGKKFIRNLTTTEIVDQVKYILKNQNIEDVNGKGERFQIMFMSMGEPFMNIDNVIEATTILHQMYGNADLLISTVGLNIPSNWKKFIEASKNNPKIGLQFSLHSGFDDVRDSIIPHKNKFSIRELRNVGVLWNKNTDRPVYLNYVVTEDNATYTELDRIMDIFPSNVFNMTFSVLCTADETMKTAGYRNMDKINMVKEKFDAEGYNTRIFDPAGQDDIGGGCGQLFYVQSWLKSHGR